MALLKSENILADTNNKLHVGPTLQQKIDKVSGTQFYPLNYYGHHKLRFIELGIFFHSS